ncbi:beta-propeller domain-containing protein [Patescibacteria group bacterium]
MSLKKATSSIAIIALAMVTFLQMGSAFAQTTSFDDVPTSYDYYDAVDYLKGEQVVEGYDDGTYKPENTMNRAEFVKIVLLSSGEEPGGSDCFPDVANQWFAPYVCKAKDLGLVQGYPDGNFKPERPINFVESGKVVSEGLDVYADDSYSDAWYHKYVEGLETEEAIPPSVDTFDQYINRGEMAEMIWRLQTDQGGDSGEYEGLKEATEAQVMKTVASCSELKEKFEDYGSNYYGYGEYEMMDSVMTGGGSIAPASTGTLTKASEETAAADPRAADDGDYSTTNLQVEGVDEADIVKTDGEYIYMVKGETIRVIQAYHPDNMVELDEVTFADDGFTPTDMYVDGDKLTVLGTSYYSYPYPLRDEPTVDIMPYPYYGGNISKVYVFDISDKENIEIFRKLEFEGNYSQSRKVDEMVYMVLNRPGFWAYPELMDAEEVIPHYRDTDDEVAKPLIECGDVKYIPAFESANYLMVVGIPTDSKTSEVSKEVVLGSSGNVYSSRDNLYVAASEWNYSYRGSNSSESTNVYKFELGRDDVEFAGKGKVPGRILNQFSMDEDGDYFRIATTKGHVWDDIPSASNVYVLDEDMDMVGKVEGIAPGEEIYSTRFMGDRLYMVTFKKIDPFFVIDLSDPKYPNILGKLKLPGYSDYLHPYDDNHIIGFGKDTAEPTEQEELDWDQDFAWYQGIKIAMFDVTDVENPTLMFQEIVGDRGTDSPLLNDHKALLFDKEKKLFAFPVAVAEIPESEKDPDMPGSTYGEFVFQGAYVYRVDLNGFDLQAKITHWDETEVADKSGYYWYGQKDVERVLYIGDYLYTVSKGMVKANDMTDGYSETNSVEVGGEDYTNTYYYD